MLATRSSARVSSKAARSQRRSAAAARRVEAALSSKAANGSSTAAFAAKVGAQKQAGRAERLVVSAAAEEIPTTQEAKVITPKTDKPMKIVFVSAEVAPWSKTGGLGDVVGSLPVELAKRGHQVMSISPRYDQYEGAWDTSVVSTVMGKDVRYFHEKKQGVDRVFIDHPTFLSKIWGKTGSKLYGKKSGHDFTDNQERFALFNTAAFDACTSLPFDYGEDVIFVANDWHSALMPVMLKTVLQPAGRFLNAKCALCVHNIAFQGRFWPTDLTKFGIPEEAMPAFAFEDGNPKVYTEDSPAAEAEEPSLTGEKFSKINWLQAGFMYSDKSLTVSPNYAKEVVSGADKGVELDEVIAASGGIEGIVNGMDVSEWNPLKDKFLDMPYDEENLAEGKAAAKQMLQAEAALDVDPDAPLFGYIGRLEEQKGVDIMLEAIPKMLEEIPNAQVVVLGTGKKKMEAAVEKLEALPGCAGICKFSSPLAHLITAGADFLMVPSRFEPCGLIQLHAMNYGTVPVVSSTGGLVDTVKEGVTGFHMGAFDPDNLEAADVDAMVTTCARAAEVFEAGAPYTAMSAACIAQDLSWEKPAQKWEAILEEMTAPTAESATKKGEVATPVEIA